MQSSEIESSRICYMPQLLPDELLYSFLARLLAYNALWTPCTYLEQLFKTRNIIPSIDLPTRLESFHRSLGHFSPWEHVDDAIDTSTLYPYHRPFLAAERHEMVYKILLGGGGKSLKTLLGRVANRFGANPPLRLCIRCIEDDIALHGVSFWHRSHQLPGVICCATHRINLVIYAPAHLSMATDRRRLILAPSHMAHRLPSESPSDNQIRFAFLANELLTAGLPALSPQLRQMTYRAAIRTQGLSSEKKGIDYAALADAVRRHYEDFADFAHRERLLATSKNPLNWLKAVVDRPLRSSHPICHLLLIGFLFGTVAKFRSSLSSSSDNDAETNYRGPNSCAESFSDTAILQMRQNQLLHDTSLSCRKIAQLLNISTTTIVLHRRALGLEVAERRKHLSSEKLSIIRAAIKKGRQLPLIAQQHGVSISTVYRLRAQSRELCESHAKAQLEVERLERRKAWQQAIHGHQGAGLHAVRGAAAATYAWLYRHDRDWLSCINSTMRAPYVRSKRVDWPARDAELCQRLEQYVGLLKSSANRPRISKTLMLRVCGDAMIRANEPRLPRLFSLLERSVESPESFQLFRIDRAIQQLVAQSQPLKLWRIQRIAGIRHFTQTLRAYASNKGAEFSRMNFSYAVNA